MTSGTPAHRREDGPDAASEPVTHALPSAADRRLLRERAGLTRAQAAARLGVSAQTLRAWERGRSRPHGRRLEAYAGLLTELTREGAGAGAVDVPRPVTTTPPTDAPDPVTATPPAEIPHPVEATPPADFPRPVTAPPTTPDITHATQATTTAQAALAPLTALTPPAAEPLPLPGPPETAFATLYARAAPGLLRQAYLLTSRPRVALAALLSGFRQAWERWPEVARDPDPEGWVRAVVHESALSPWRGFGGRGRRAAPADAGQAALAGALLRLPPPHRRVVLLYEGVGLDLPETAAEVEASTRAAAHRLLHARESLTAALPELAARPEQLAVRLRAFLAEGEVPGRPAPLSPETALADVRLSGRARTGAALTVAGLLAASTLYAVATTDSSPPPPPATEVDGTLTPAPGPPPPATTRDRPPAEGPGTGPGRLVPLGG
ncbi:DNA-directed RNA polymerase specialized sigma subunit, sigma24 family [Streptomyces sp. LcepLS]|nr:helix-turn-helix transcriptional regulator [Streptomyces sp. SID4945]MYR25298.1 helix-turn-helix domain-containing protein [Streptomyces sp. SID4945]SCE78146.1 DNA-directed RNA polymerase specialized sigma subunit, sigma24 family [Streptomyces sp. LcepLS]